MSEPLRCHGVTLEQARMAAHLCSKSERAWVAKLPARELAVVTELKVLLGAREVDDAGYPL